MTELLYAGDAAESRPRSPQATQAVRSLGDFALQRLNALRPSRPQYWLAAILTLTLHAAALSLLNRPATLPVTAPPRPQPVSVELVAAVPEEPAPEVVEPAAPSEPEPPPPETKTVDENALLPPVVEKKPPPAAKKKVAVKKRQTAPKPPAEPKPASASTAPSPAAAQAPLTPPLANADYLHNPAPAYPDVAISRGHEGTVLLNVQVRADGKVQTIRIQKSSGYPALDDAARDTVLRWSFVPARRGNQAVSGWVIVPIDFSLNS
ncbi:energy transducer TonB [Brenneria tiliae]|uniref:Energy transducer TonB n=1 Tax=Brenneria tiliae TaxID=2914984 RepID=A0ABT0MRR5_9GAMM|nr:energy transducer TonB [Brenneria tiliae]MCL2891889.1 energy transducer TonB [Brenneria tiliae]